MRIRPFRPGDAPALALIYHAAVHEIGALHYSPAQVEAWAPEVPDPDGFVRRAADGRVLLVAADEDDEPLAYGDLEPDGHIDHLYCRPDVAGTGVASELYDRLEAEARHLGIGRLYVEASEPARRFFLRKGFVLLHRRDFTLRGVAIHNFAMEKRLEAVSVADG
jgi:putative acetyltransferase